MSKHTSLIDNNKLLLDQSIWTIKLGNIYIWVHSCYNSGYKMPMEELLNYNLPFPFVIVWQLLWLDNRQSSWFHHTTQSDHATWCPITHTHYSIGFKVKFMEQFTVGLLPDMDKVKSQSITISHEYQKNLSILLITAKFSQVLVKSVTLKHLIGKNCMIFL